MRSCASLFIGLCGLALTAQAAAPIQSLAAIDAAVRQHVAASLEPAADIVVQVGRLDPRLRLAPCSNSLQVRDARSGGNSASLSVEVRCEGTQPWSLYVPVTLERHAEVVVAARALPRNAALTPADLTLSRRRVNPYAADYYTSLAEVSGQIAARSIPAGQVLGGGNLKRPQLVRRGDQVVLTTLAGSIKVSVQGRALENGGLGERIDVRNVNSKRVVEGEVVAAGMVVVRTGATVLSMGSAADKLRQGSQTDAIR